MNVLDDNGLAHVPVAPLRLQVLAAAARTMQHPAIDAHTCAHDSDV